MQSIDEHRGHAFFQASVGQIGERLARDGKHFLLGPQAQRLVQVAGVVPQRLFAFGADDVGRLAGVVEKALTFGLRLVRGLAQETGALAVELFVLVLESVALLLGFGLLALGIRQFPSDQFLARIDGV